MPESFSQNVNDLVADQNGGSGLYAQPQLVWLSSDRYVVVWLWSAASSSTYDIFARVFSRDGTAVTDAFQVNSVSSGQQNSVHVDATQFGGFYVTWEGETGEGLAHQWSVFGRGFIGEDYQPQTGSDVLLSGDTRVLPNDNTFFYGFIKASGDGDFAINTDGRRLVTWTTDGTSGDPWRVMGRILDSDGVPSGVPFQIASSSVQAQARSIADLPSGGFAVLYAVWSETDGVHTFLQLYNGSEKNGSPIALSFDATDVAYAGLDKIVVVGQLGESNPDVVAQIFQINDRHSTGLIPVPTSADGSEQWASVTGFSDTTSSGFIVSWVDDGNLGVRVFRVDIDPNTLDPTPLQDEFSPLGPGISAEPGLGLPSVGSSVGGGFAIAWTGANQTQDHIFVDSYIEAPPPNSIVGTAGNDLLNGTDMDDTISGLGGADVIRPGEGDDLIDGGSGIDRVAYYQTDAALGGVRVSLAKQGSAQDLGWAGKDTLTGIENVSGTPFADILEGDEGANWLWGAPSRDGSAFYANNNDILAGYGGNDLLVVGTGNHILSGGFGNDTVVFTDGGEETVGVVVSLLKQDVAQDTGAGGWFLVGIENLSGGVKDDTLTGDGNVNILAGDEGNDTLIGMAGNDRLYGDGYFWVNSNGVISLFVSAEGGNDILIGGPGEDALFGGPGIDTASYAGDEGGVFVNLTLGRGYGNASFGDTYDSIENVIGTDYNDFIIGDPGTNRLDGAGGDDTIIGAVGPDEIIGGPGLDWASYEDNSGTVFVNLTLRQGFNNAAHGDTYDGIENLIGGLMDDFFIGDEGANRLNGAMGADTLLGAGGADIFMFTYAPGATSTWGNPNVDLILDFTTGEDVIELSSAAFAGLSAGTLSESAFYAGTAAHDGDDRIVYDAASGKLWFDPDGNGAQAAMLFATLGETSHPAAIAASDFVVV